MSLKNIITATCPNCKKEFPFEVWNSVNVQLNPEMREKILNGSIFKFTCPHCKFSAQAEYPILYDDMENHFMIYFCREEDVEENARQLKEIIAEIKDSVPEEIFASSFFRITTSYVQFVEKIKIFESKNDDRLIELMKLDLLKDANRNNQENQTAFILFDMLPNEEFSPKVPVPSLVYYNENCEKESAFPISIIPGEVGKIKNEYDYLGDKSFVVDSDWAAHYIFTEKVGHDFFDVEFNKIEFSARGTNIAKKLLDLLDKEEKDEILNSLEDDEKSKIINATGRVDNQKIFDSLQAFYRYTNFKNVLEEMIEDRKRFESHDTSDGRVFNFDRINMQDFYTEYFKISSESFPPAVVHFVHALIHGAKLDPNHPFNFYFKCRNKKAFWFCDDMNGEKEHDISVMKQYYKKYENNEDGLAYKNCVVRYIYQYKLPSDDILRIDPLKTKEMWDEHEILSSKFFCYNPNKNPTAEERRANQRTYINDTLKIWEVAFDKHDVADCFAEFSDYFYSEGEYRNAWINLAVASAYAPQNIAFSSIKKQYRGEISSEEFQFYKEETGFPLGANPKIQNLIQERYKKSCKENNLFAQVYYLNLFYNYCDEKSDEATQIDSMLNELLRKIEL